MTRLLMLTLAALLPGTVALAQNGTTAAAPTAAELRQKHDALKNQQTELAAKAAAIGQDLAARQAKLQARQAELDQTKEIQELRKTLAEAQVALNQFVTADPELTRLREAHGKAQAAVDPTRHTVLNATEKAKAIAKERGELEFKDALLEFKVRESDFAAERHVAPRLYREHADLAAAAQKREALGRRLDQTRHDAENGSAELRQLRAEADQTRAAYEQAYTAAKPAELDALRKLRAEREAAFQELHATTLKTAEQALNEARTTAAKVRDEVTGKDQEAVELRGKLAALHRQRAELEYQIALADFQLREGVGRRLGFDPQVRKAEAEVQQAEHARWQQENADPKLAAARQELDELRRQSETLEAKPNSLPAVAAAGAAWQVKEKAYHEQRAKVHAEAVAALQPAYDEAAKAEADLRQQKYAADAEYTALNRKKSGFDEERVAGRTRRAELDAEWRTAFEQTAEATEVKAATEAAAAAAKAYDDAYAASAVPKLQQTIAAAEQALRDKTAELQQGDNACAALSAQVAEVQQQANELNGRVASAAKELDDTAFQIVALGLKPAAIAKKDLVNGLVLKCFETQGMPTPDFEKGTPAKTAKAETVDLALRSRDENIGLAFAGYLEIPKDGEYTFALASDDGSFLQLAGMEIINNGGYHGVVEVTRKLSLVAGLYPLKVTFFQGGGGYGLTFAWSGPGIEKQAVPGTALYALPADLPKAEPAKTAE